MFPFHIARKVAISAFVAATLSVSFTADVRADDIVDTAAKAGQFKTLITAVKAAGLVETLKSNGPFTVFAPTDDAFAKLPKGVLSLLLQPENRDKLRSVLTYHVLPGEVTAERFARLKRRASDLKTVNGATVRVSNQGDLKVNASNLVKTNLFTDNGVIHVIDAVLLPPNLKLPSVSSNEKQTSNGDLIETAGGAGQFMTLIKALQAAGLVEALKGEGPFTVFAPNDEAFARINRHSLNDLLKPENRDLLKSILTYHVVPGRILAKDIKNSRNGSELNTLNGARLEIRNRRGLRVDDSRIIKGDILTSNGVIHVIDTVLMPPH